MLAVVAGQTHKQAAEVGSIAVIPDEVVPQRLSSLEDRVSDKRVRLDMANEGHDVLMVEDLRDGVHLVGVVHQL